VVVRRAPVGIARHLFWRVPQSTPSALCDGLSLDMFEGKSHLCVQKDAPIQHWLARACTMSCFISKTLADVDTSLLTVRKIAIKEQIT